MEKLLRDLDLLNRKLKEITFDRLNPNLLKDYISLIGLDEIIDLVTRKLEEEKDGVRVDILVNKINIISSLISKNTFYKKSTFSRKITMYFYTDRIDLYIKKDFEEKTFNLAFKEVPEVKDFKIYIDNKEVKYGLELKYEDLSNFLSNIKNKDEMKLKLFIQNSKI